MSIYKPEVMEINCGQELNRKESISRYEGASGVGSGTPTESQPAMSPDMHSGWTHRGRGAKTVPGIAG